MTNIFFFMCLIGLNIVKLLLLLVLRVSKDKQETLKNKLFFGWFTSLCTAGFIPMTIAFYLGVMEPVDGEGASNMTTWIVGFLIFVFYPLALITNILVGKETTCKPGYMLGSLQAPFKNKNRW